MKTNSNAWTINEDTILVNTYPLEGKDKCQSLLPHRTRAAISTRLQFLKLKRTNLKSGLEKAGVDEQWVVDKYRELKSKTAVANLLGMSPVTILSILRKHGAEKIKHWALDDKKTEVIAAYMQPELSPDDLCVKFNVCWPTIRESIKRWGVTPPPHRNTTHESLSGGRSTIWKNETYFDVIDTPEKAYWLGLIYADGYNGDDKTGSLILGLQARDVELVEKLSMAILGKIHLKKIEAKTHKWKDLTINGHGAYKFQVSSKHMCKSLVRVGVHRAKSQTLIFPNPDQVPSHLLNHFMLGYFDGDGCVTVSKRPPFRDRYTFSIISTQQFCEEYQRVLKERVGVNARLHKQLTMTILTLSGNAEIEKAMKWLYEGGSIALSRKRSTYDRLCSYNITNPKALGTRGLPVDKKRLP